IDDAGAKGIEKRDSVKKEIELKLAETNKVLAAANPKDTDGKALMDALASRNKLAGELKELTQTFEAAHKELTDAKLVAPSGDPRKDLVAGAKAARIRAESPVGGQPPISAPEADVFQRANPLL